MEFGYLISYDISKQNLCHLNDVDPLDTINIFEIVRINSNYQITKVIRNTHGNFNVGDIIYTLIGNSSYYNKDSNGNILHIDNNKFVIKKKSSIVFTSREINDAIEKAISKMRSFKSTYPNSIYNDFLELLK